MEDQEPKQLPLVTALETREWLRVYLAQKNPNPDGPPILQSGDAVVESRDESAWPKQDMSGLYGFEYYSVDVATINGKPFMSEPYNPSPSVWIGREVSPEVAALNPAIAASLPQFAAQGIKRFFICEPYGFIWPARDGDEIREPQAQVLKLSDAGLIVPPLRGHA